MLDTKASKVFEQDGLRDYQIKQLLGQGGMSSVYLAEDLQLQRAVAIKILNLDGPHHSVNDGLKEARLLARLNHPNIVQIYQVLPLDNEIALVMECLSGKTLYQCQREQMIPLVQKLQWLYQISDGLAAAHAVGVIHCDLKLANILIGDNQTVKITDFGISQLQTEQQKSGQHYGSQASMSPEQLQNQPIDYRSDLFSLGVLAYQLIVGQHPFGSGHGTDIARRIVTDAPMDAYDVTPPMPPTLAALLNQLLAKTPAQRPDSTINVAERFKQILTAFSQQEILNQATVPIDPVLPLIPEDANLQNNANIKPNIKSKAKKRPRWILFLPLVAMGLMVGVWFTHQMNGSAMRHIAVLQPTFIGGEIAPMQKDLVSGAIDHAIRQTVMFTDHMNLISYHEVAAIAGGVKMIGQASGATDIIATELDCNNSRCKVTLSRLGGEGWLVQKQQHWPVAIDSLAGIDQSTQRYFTALYPELSFNALPQQTVSEQDYLIYLRLYHQVNYKSGDNVAVLNQLKQVLTRSPYLFAGYELYRETARQLYNQTRELNYLTQLEQLMQAAPPEYRYSAFQSIDAFWLAFSRNDLAEAKKQLTVAQKRGANPFTLLELNAYWFKANNAPEQSIDYYLRALKIRPSTALLYNLAIAYFQVGDFAQAQSTLHRLLSVTPANYNANQLLGSIFLLEGDVTAAISIYEKIVAKASKSIDLSNLSLAYALEGEHKKALDLAHLAVEKNPKHPTWLLNLADAQAIQGLQQYALVHYQQVIELHQGRQDLKSWLERAQALVHTGANEAAVKALNKAKKLAPNNGEVAFTAALVFAQLNEHISAVTQVEEALALDIGVIWFNLPWFDVLCDSPQFNRIMQQQGNQQRCPD